ncbi:MAG: hypothetical protein H8E85_00910 [Candidatus Marinimicrobia bacterium]|nr:hypothetical protein [Candidatus Neomarinimicrobiota bacterium]
MNSSIKYKDSDPQETQEWIDSIRSILETSGTGRTHFLLEKLIEFARRNGVRMPYSANTDYVNTIPPSHQKPFPGEAVLAIEMGADAEDIGLSIHPHPTLTETLSNAAEMFSGTITDLYIPK